MHTAVTQTSIEAYHDINLNDQQKDVMLALRVLGESCIADIANYLNWDKSTVSGRLNELKSKKKIVFVGKRKSATTERTSEFWRIADYQPTLF